MQEEIYSLFVAYVQSEMYYTISIANDKNTYKYNDVTPNPRPVVPYMQFQS